MQTWHNKTLQQVWALKVTKLRGVFKNKIIQVQWKNKPSIKELKNLMR